MNKIELKIENLLINYTFGFNRFDDVADHAKTF